MSASFPTPPDGSVTPAKLAGSPSLGVDQVAVWDGSVFVPGDLAAGSVASVNGASGVVVLGASDVGAQPVDSDLTAIAALSTTTFGRSLLALADAAAGRTALGLGTAATTASSAYDVAGAAAAAQAASQPLDSDLTAIAALTTTSYGRAFLALADAAAARTALGLGTAATSASTDFQPLDSDLTALAAIAPANDDLVQRKAGAWTNRTPAQVKTDLALVKGDVGLGNVDNTADTAKPVSTAQQTALNLKADLASPALTGTPTVPTAAVDTSTTQAASTAFVVAQAASATPVVDGTGAAGTSTRFARADHVHPTDTSRAPLASPTFTGTPAAPTQSAGDNSTKLATTAYADAIKGAPLGLTGATAATRYVGATTSGAPASGTFAVGDFIIDRTGKIYVCTSAGSPGTWTQAGGSSYFGLHRSGGYYPVGVVTSGTILTVDGTEYAMPLVIDKAVTVDRLSVSVTTAGSAGSVIRMGIRADSGSGLPASTVVVDAGTVASATTGQKEITLSQALSPGLYWVVVASQGTPTTAPTLRVTTSGPPIPLGWTSSIPTDIQPPTGYNQTGVTGALPSSYTLAAVPGSAGVPQSWVRFA